MDIIPQVFELARMYRSCKDAQPRDVTLTYEEYKRFAKVYRELPENAQRLVEQLVNARKASLSS